MRIHITSACCRTVFPLRSKPAANAGVDIKLGLSVFESRYRNDYNGAQAYDLHSYSKLTEVYLKNSVTSKSIKHYYEAAEYKGIH